MTLFDIILIVLIFGFVFYGLFFGLIHALGGLIGVFIGTIVAGRLFEPLAEWVAPVFHHNMALSKVLCFIFLFIIINRAVGLLFFIFDRIFKFLQIIPFLKTINRLLGAVLGFLEGTFLIGGILYIAIRFPFWEWLNETMIDSVVARYLIYIFGLISPLLPEAIRQLKEFVFNF